MWGLLAEFDGHAPLESAARAARRVGYVRLEAYSPYPLDSVATAVGHRATRLGWAVLVGGLVGAAGGFVLQWYLMAVDYPINVGGRPLNSWPAFIPVTFELMVLFASFTGVVALVVRLGLPRLHHPLFSVPAFERASRRGFFLCIEAADPRFSPEWTARLLRQLGARQIYEVSDA
jgi:ActD protein